MPTDSSMSDLAGDPDSWPETFRIPSDATRGYSDRVNQALAALADRTATNRDRALGQPLWLPMFSGMPATAEAPTARFQATMGLAGPPPTFRGGWLQTDVTDTGLILWETKVPKGAYLHGVYAYVIGEPISVASLPATMPRVKLYKQPTDGSSHVLITEAIDPSPDAPSFRAFHTLGAAWGTATDLLDEDLIIVEFRGMAGGGALANGLKLVAIKLLLDTQETIVLP